VFMYTPAPLVSWDQDHSSQVDLETLLGVICGAHPRERRLVDENLNLNRQLMAGATLYITWELEGRFG
jgi:hypothetical protein